jgi:MFS family permease
MESSAGCCMEPNLQPAQHRATFSGVTGLIVAVVVVGILLLAFPAYRWFFLISLGIGLVVAAILFLWHKFRPIREEDVHNKRPLGLG